MESLPVAQRALKGAVGVSSTLAVLMRNYK